MLILGTGVLVYAQVLTTSVLYDWLSDSPHGMVTDSHYHSRYPLLGDHVALMLSFAPFPYITPLLLGSALLAGLAWAASTLQFRGYRPLLFAWGSAVALSAVLSRVLTVLLVSPDVSSEHMEVCYLDLYSPSLDWHFPTLNASQALLALGAMMMAVGTVRFISRSDRQE